MLTFFVFQYLNFCFHLHVCLFFLCRRLWLTHDCRSTGKGLLHAVISRQKTPIAVQRMCRNQSLTLFSRKRIKLWWMKYLKAAGSVMLHMVDYSWIFGGQQKVLTLNCWHFCWTNFYYCRTVCRNTRAFIYNIVSLISFCKRNKTFWTS